MTAQSSFEFISVVGGGGGGGGATLFLTEQRGGVELIFLFWRGVLSKFLLYNSSFSAPPTPLIIIAQSLISLQTFFP